MYGSVPQKDFPPKFPNFCSVPWFSPTALEKIPRRFQVSQKSGHAVKHWSNWLAVLTNHITPSERTVLIGQQCGPITEEPAAMDGCSPTHGFPADRSIWPASPTDEAEPKNTNHIMVQCVVAREKIAHHKFWAVEKFSSHRKFWSKTQNLVLKTTF